MWGGCVLWGGEERAGAWRVCAHALLCRDTFGHGGQDLSHEHFKQVLWDIWVMWVGPYLNQVVRVIVG